MRLDIVKLFDVVAMSDRPSADDVMIEFGENDVAPVPPYTTPIDVVAETIPAFACSGPLKDVSRVNLPETDSPVVEAYGNVDAVVVVAVKYAPTTCPTTESDAYGDVVPIPTSPDRNETFVFGSNQYSELVDVAFPPIATMSVSLFG